MYNYRFPVVEKMRPKWLSDINETLYILLRYSVVYSRYFVDDDE